MELLIGCGNARDKKLRTHDMPADWSHLVTLDMFADTKPDVVWNLENVPLPFADGIFDEVHAYDVLEHVGALGDWRFFFAQFQDFWRILKPGGMFCAITPHPTSPWAWGDPGHTRVIPPESLQYLSQAQYEAQVGSTPMTDYRSVYSGDFEIVNNTVSESRQTLIVLRAIK